MRSEQENIVFDADGHMDVICGMT